MTAFIIGGGLSLLGSLFGGSAADSAAQTQANAANQASATQLQMFNQTQATEAPFVQGGVNALNQIQTGIGNGSLVANTANPTTPFNFTQSPGYNWQLGQGEQAILDTASATGGVGGGNTLKALTNYGQGLAQQDYANAFNQWLQTQNLALNTQAQGNAGVQQNYNELAGLLNVGQGAAAGQASNAIATGQSIGNNQISAGNSLSAGTVGASNALTGGLNNIGNNFILSQLLQNGGLGGGMASMFNTGNGASLST